MRSVLSLLSVVCCGAVLLPCHAKEGLLERQEEMLKGRNATFVLKTSRLQDAGEGVPSGTKPTVVSSQIVFNPDRAGVRFPPCSTYKIPHTLIALEERVVSSPDQVVKWDEKQFTIDPDIGEELRRKWAQDMTLRKAFQCSCVWFYQRISRHVPPATMKGYLEKFDYGNKDNSGQRDRFWLGEGNTLQISAMEQVAFLEKLHRRAFPLSPQTYNQAEQVFLTEDAPGYALYSKTGTGKLPSGRYVGWQVGYAVQKGAGKAPGQSGTVFYFAFNMEGKNMDDIVQNRPGLVRELLRLHGVVD